MGTVYLIHFETPYKHARHYIGYTSGKLEDRMATHRKGRGARLMEVITEAGINWRVVRTWKGGRDRERQLKRQGGASRSCPVCKDNPNLVGTVHP